MDRILYLVDTRIKNLEFKLHKGAIDHRQYGLILCELKCLRQDLENYLELMEYRKLKKHLPIEAIRPLIQGQGGCQIIVISEGDKP